MCAKSRSGSAPSGATSEMTAYAADIDLLLAFYNCLDDWADDKSRLKELGAKQLMDAFLSARARRMRQAFAIEKQLGRLRRFERERSGDVLGAADCFGSMLGEVFAYRDDMWAPALKNMGAALGRFIYIMDDIPAGVPQHPEQQGGPHAAPHAPVPVRLHGRRAAAVLRHRRALSGGDA